MKKFIIALTLILWTNVILAQSEEEKAFSKVAPVGMIVQSLLPPIQFQNYAGKKWIPADGRKIKKTSLYAILTGKNRVPDLRGMFLRGLNTFDEDTRNDGKEDPDGSNRTPGNYQDDSYAKHIHKMGVNGADTTTMVGNGATQRLAHFNPGAYGAGAPKQTHEAGDGKETRPKNVAVYYYVKIQ
jgi:hypothetical protein